MERTIEIEAKKVYGNQTIYPVNEQAKNLAAIAGTKTLTESTLRKAKAMGFEITIKTTQINF